MLFAAACGSSEAGDAVDAPAPGATRSDAVARPGRHESRITGIVFDAASLNRFPNGTDIWPITWAADGYLYTAGGDGIGWDQHDTRGLSVVRLDLAGPTADLEAGGVEIASKINVLPKGLISVDGVLYLLEQERGNGFARARIGKSADLGRTWDYSGDGETTWDIEQKAFAQGHFINYGRDNAGARDTFVYVVGVESAAGDAVGMFDRIVLARVPAAAVPDVDRWQYFIGTPAAPAWSSSFEARTAVLRRDGEIHWGPTISYNPVLERYLLCFFTNQAGGLAVYEGPEPWGPWRQIHESQLLDATEKYSVFFVNKPGWLSGDGREWWLVTSGEDEWDSFNALRARLETGTDRRAGESSRP